MSFACGISVVLVSCNGDRKPVVSDSANPVVAKVPSSQPVGVNTGWDDASAGPVMLLAGGDDPSTVALVLPRQTDSTLSAAGVFPLDSLSNLSVELFGPEGIVGRSSLVVTSQKQPGEGCVAWPVAHLANNPPAPWKIGLVSGRATSIKLDSIEGMSPADSSMVSTELARAASEASVNGDPVFQGLHFTVQKAYRLSLGRTSVIVGSIVRKINEEANPREEHFLLVAESSESSGGKYVLSFQSRSAGSEDDIRTSSVIAAIRFVRNDRPAIVISFEYNEGGQVALLERTADHQWKITWRSAYTGC